MEQRVVALREQHPAWGGRKIARRLEDLGVAGVPSPSTVTEILRRAGRLDAAEAARHRAFKRFERSAPNELWQMDFKGHFALAGGDRCHALTVLDDHCRYNLGLRACADEQDATVREQLVGVFKRYGQPEAILADNGAPWGSAGAGESRMTSLGVWLMLHGIGLLHGRPRHPQTQGKDERFHRTLDVELLQHNRFANLAACQAAFDAWRVIYNEQRPHDALELDTPDHRYKPSPRCYIEKPPAPLYDSTDQVRRVNRDGYISFQSRQAKLSQAYAGQNVALRPTQTDGVWNIYFSRFRIGQIDLNEPQNPLKPVRHVSEHLSDLSPV
jgi:transposase InsO family protein